MRQRACIWRPAAALLATGSSISLGVAFWNDDIVVALALAPLVVGALLTLTDRTVGVIILLAGAMPPALLAVGSALHSVALPPTGGLCVLAALGALGLFALLAPRLVRFNPSATSLAALLAVPLGLGATIVMAAPARGLQSSYWVSQGERAALRDWDRGRLELRTYNGQKPYAGCEAALSSWGIHVRHFEGWPGPEKEALQSLGYDQVARDLIASRHGATLFQQLGCGVRYYSAGGRSPALTR